MERSFRDEESVLLIGSPMCRACSTLIELTQAGKPSEVRHKSLVEQCVTHLKFCFRMYERSARRLFLHEHPWDAWSRGFSFVKEIAEKDRVFKTEGDRAEERISVHFELRVHHRRVGPTVDKQRTTRTTQ